MQVVSYRIFLRITMSIILSGMGFVHASDSPTSPHAVKVKAVVVSTPKGANTITGMGSISCQRNLELGFDDRGCISEMQVEEGDYVRQGQTLAKLEDSVTIAEKSAVEARLNASIIDVKFYENEVTRTEELYKKEAVSETELKKMQFQLEKAKAAVDVSKAELDTLEARVKTKTLLAPIEGFIARKHADVGSTLMPGQNKVLSLVQCREAYADIELGEKLYNLVREGQTAVIRVDAMGDTAFKGKVSRVGPQIDERNRTFIAKIKIPNPHLALRPNMFARAEIQVADKQSIWLPKTALVQQASERALVLLVKDGMAVLQDVLVGEESQGRVQIVKGLVDGDVVIVEGHAGVSDRTAVSPTIVDEKTVEP